MKVVAYTRISTDAQDLDKQKHLLLAYAQQQKLMIDEFIEVTISSRESPRERKIDVLLEKLQPSRLASKPRKIRSGQQGIIHG